MKITACFITKNEEKNISKAINSIQGMYDELIVVDTGSTDKTVAVAQTYGAQIYHFIWQNDFSLARNFTIEQATGDWIIFLDADNYYVGDVDIRCYLENIENTHSEIDGLLLQEYDETFPEKPPSQVGRIFRNRPYIRYHGAIHEVIGGVGQSIKLYIAKELKIMHSGYHPRKIQKKLKRNLELLLDDTEKNGFHDTNFYYLAECYFGLREYEKAIVYIKKAIASPVRHYQEEANYYHILLESMRQCQYDAREMADVGWKAIKKFPEMPEFYGEQGIILSSMGRVDEAFSLLNKCVEKYELADRQSQDFGYFTDETMGIIYARLARIAILQEKYDYAQLAACLSSKVSQGKWGKEEKKLLVNRLKKCNNKRVIICVPIYKKELSAFEKASLKQLNNVLGNYPRVFIAPNSLEFDFDEYGKGMEVERFPDYYFHSVISYSALMLNIEFYQRFSSYEYVLVYQTDAFVFVDRMQEFCDLNYDYIGAPMERENPMWSFIGNRVGNGGLSLRKVSTAIRILGKWEELVSGSALESMFMQWEDLFWGYCSKQKDLNFKVPNVKTALEFAVQVNIGHACQRIRKGWRPFGCHGWWQMDYEFWKPIIESYGFNFGREVNPAKNRYPYLQHYLQSRGNVNMHYLWGLYTKSRFNKMLSVLDGWLMRYKGEYVIWQNVMGELICLWRIVEDSTHSHEWKMACQLRLTEAILRSLNQEVKYPLFWNMLITMVPHLKRYDYAVMKKLANNICVKWWEVWASDVKYQKVDSTNNERKNIVLTKAMDESDVIESFIRHTLTFADAILVDVSIATEKVKTILVALEDEGKPLIIHEKKLKVEHIHEGVDIVLELSPRDFLLPQMSGTTVRSILENIDLNDGCVVENWAYTTYLPFAYEDEFALSRPLLRIMTSKKYRFIISPVDDNKKTITEDLYLLTLNNEKRIDVGNGIIPADMELVDISNYINDHKLKYIDV